MTINPEWIVAIGTILLAIVTVIAAFRDEIIDKNDTEKSHC